MTALARPASSNPFQAYCARIGAVVEGPGRAYIPGPGYAREGVSLGRDGRVAAPEGREPSEAEAEAIREATLTILREKWAAMPAPPTAGEPELEGRVFRYRDRDGRLCFLVQRIDQPGGKVVLPWAWYPEEGWVQRRPPQVLPLYGNHWGRSRIMVHEGEKAVDAALDPAHPWADHLRYFGHCTWAGGTNRVGGSDWSPLDECEVYILGDNDAPGRKAAADVAARLRRARGVYLLDHRLLPTPPKWDIADPLPGVSWSEVESAFRIGERAFNTILDDKGRPVHYVRDEWCDKFCYCSGTEEIVERARPTTLLKPAAFNLTYAHLSPVRDLAQRMVASTALPKVDLPGYDPTRDTGSQWVEDGVIYVNRYRPGPVRPGRGTIRPAMLFLRHLIPDLRERKILARWLCAVIANTPRRFHWAVLLISQAQGVGKTTLSDVLSYLVGVSNFQTLTGQVVQETHNGWAAACRVACVEEMMEGRPFQMYNDLKQYITNERISIRRMRTDSYTVPNHMYVLSNSNYDSSLSIPEDDRRWFVPSVTAATVPEDPLILARYRGRDPARFFADFREWVWRRGGAEAILGAAQRYATHVEQVMRRGGDPAKGLSTRAPMTDRKAALIERAEPEWWGGLLSLLDEEPGLVVSDQDLAAWVTEQDPRARVSVRAIADRLEAAGWRRVTRDRVRVVAGRQAVHLRARGEVSPPWVEVRVRWLSERFERSHGFPADDARAGDSL